MVDICSTSSSLRFKCQPWDLIRYFNNLNLVKKSSTLSICPLFSLLYASIATFLCLFSHFEWLHSITNSVITLIAVFRHINLEYNFAIHFHNYIVYITHASYILTIDSRHQYFFSYFNMLHLPWRTPKPISMSFATSSCIPVYETSSASWGHVSTLNLYSRTGKYRHQKKESSLLIYPCLCFCI